MKLEVGMLLRTKEGIRKIEDVWEDMYDLNRCLHNRYPEGHPLFEEDIEEVVLKASHNIIDLIQVGDYVNGVRVDELSYNRFTNAKAVTTNNSLRKDTGKQYWFENEDIKSIVTKEQFESMSYKL